jgi:hypothetical protein
VQDQDVMVMNVIIEDLYGNPVDQAGLQDWADEFGLTMPVVSDPSGSYMWSHVEGGSVGLPYAILLDRGVVIDTLVWSTIDDAVDLAAE